MKKVSINLGRRSYNIIIESGMLATCGSIIEKHLTGKKTAIVSDTTVAEIYAPAVERSLKESGFETALVGIESGENSKNMETVSHVCRQFIDARLDRSSAVIALGGGVTGDIAGFAAAIFMRGIHVIQIPTTLLACCDSSVGGKVGINFNGIKNMLGAFYQPEAVLVDPETLKTLPRREVISGLAEAIKTGLIGDSGLYEMTVDRLDDIMNLSDMELIGTLIYRSARIKADVVSRDEREAGLRRILNFGHTIGHGIEAAASGALLHGEAVLIGMCAAVWLSHSTGKLAHDSFHSIVDSLARLPVPYDISSISSQKALEFIKNDKKTIDSNVRFILLESIGKPCESQEITEKDMSRAIAFVQELYT